MIRLIATDMDGTLLRSDGTIHSGIFPLIYRLAEKEIYFVIASGRPVFNLRNIFKTVQDKIGIIAFNGAWCEWEGVPYLCMPVSPEVCRKAVLEARKHPGLDCSLDTVEKGFVENEQSSYWKWKEARGWIEKADLMEVIEKEVVFRIKLSGFEEETYPPVLSQILPQFQGKTEIIRADRNGIDLSGVGNGKGKALEKLQGILGVKPEETLVFGDYYNDLSLFECAAYRVAPENACPELKQKATRVIEDHNSDSVYRAIEIVYKKGELE